MRTLRRPADLAVPAAVAAGIDSAPTPHTARLAAFLVNAFGPTTAAVIHYGSHAQRSDAREESAHDFFLVVDSYRAAFDHLAAEVGTRFSPHTATVLAHWLPPNVVALGACVNGQAAPAKCAIYSTAHFLQATSDAARDHFAQGRLFQHVQLVWTRDAMARDLVIRALVATRVRTFDWVRPGLPDTFDVDGYLRALLETSFAAEIRTEPAARLAVLLDAQRPLLRAVYGALLERLADAGEVTRVGSDYRLAACAEPTDRRRLRRYFARTKRRSTLRWAKYVVLYDDWLGYIVRKIERRRGIRVDLTARERRWPFIFLWPRAIRFLLDRPQNRGE